MAKQTPRRPAAPAPKPQSAAAPRKPAPAPVRRAEKRESIFLRGHEPLIYGRQNFIIMGVGVLLVVAGLVLMAGGSMPDPNVWEPERIYSFRRITLAPILMVAGFVAVAVGIFKKSNAETAAAETPDNQPEA